MITIIQDSHFVSSIAGEDVDLMVHIANDHMLIVSSLMLVCVPSCAKIRYPSILSLLSFSIYIHVILSRLPSCFAIVWNRTFQLQGFVVLVEVKQSDEAVVGSGDHHVTVGRPVTAGDRIAMLNRLQRLRFGISFAPHAQVPDSACSIVG